MVTTIRSATAADIDQLVALELGTYADEGYPAPLFYQALAQWSPWLFIAERDNAVVGYVLAAPGSENSLWIMSLLVANSLRGEGIGRQLMQTLLAQVLKSPNRFSTIALTVSPNNLGAIHLYRQLGFKDIEQIDDFMGPNQHRLLMQINPC